MRRSLAKEEKCGIAQLLNPCRKKREQNVPIDRPSIFLFIVCENLECPVQLSGK